MESDARTGKEANGRAIVRGESVRLSPATARVRIPGQPAEPHLELIREAGVIREIDLTCDCGRRHRLKCVYDA